MQKAYINDKLLICHNLNALIISEFALIISLRGVPRKFNLYCSNFWSPITNMAALNCYTM